MSRIRYYRFDVECHWCGSSKGCRRYGFQWICVDCEEQTADGKKVPYDERSSDRALWRSQGGHKKYQNTRGFGPSAVSLRRTVSDVTK